MKKMNIGLYGGLANNLYLMAKALDADGHTVTFIRERDISYAVSQPVWEDCELLLTTGELQMSNNYSAEKWTDIESELGWRAQSWLWDALAKECDGEEYSQLLRKKMGFSKNDAAILRKMRECNFLVVTGVKAAILAHESGVPYVIQPHGGDIMIAAGCMRITPPKRNLFSWVNVRELLYGNQWEHETRRAFNAAVAFGVHNKYIDQTTFLRSSFLKRTFLPRCRPLRPSRANLATCTTINKPLSAEQKHKLRDELSAKLGVKLSTDKQLVFVPTRIDYFWKGQDKLVKALENKKISREFSFVFCGWGTQLEELKKTCQDHAVSASFLPNVLSKQLLYKMMAASDLVVENLTLGHYGTTGAEAMGQGCPVLMWCDAKQYGGEEHLPPVLNVHSANDIENALIGCCNGETDLVVAGEKAYQWAKSHHSGSVVVSQLAKIFKA
ncbi:glycosyltransferase [Thalassospira sp. SM2505]